MTRKILTLPLAAALMAVFLCACQTKQESAPDETQAVGVIFINSSENLPKNEKVYANFSNRQYLFYLDAASVYYFSANQEESYAGDEGFSRLTFAAQIDEDTVGALGTVCYQSKAGADNALNVYYLYRDETGVYFQPGSAVEQVIVEENKTLTLTEYPCEIEIKRTEPAEAFTITYYDKAAAVLRTQTFQTADTEDGARFEVPNQTAYVEVETLSAKKEPLETQRITAENDSACICYEAGGQVLQSKILRFIWE